MFHPSALRVAAFAVATLLSSSLSFALHAQDPSSGQGAREPRAGQSDPRPQGGQGRQQQGRQQQGRRQQGRQQGGRPSVAPGGSARERMWPAPTQEDWAKPCLIPFQRSWEDALAVSKETQKPILICVNMDGEIASEHYAGIRYREAAKAKLYEPYVCVIASVYRHSPRDYDQQGRRVLCPRFGSVTCGEHIRIEPMLYEKYFDGKRIAPRHVMVELDGSESYDVYYAYDTDSVFDAIRDGIDEREIKPKPIVRGDRSLVERVASRDRKDREAVEKAFLEGDAALRARLLDAAKKNPQAAPEELLRLAVFSLDQKLGKVAREALAKAKSQGAIDVINEALRVPLGKDEKRALVDALARLGKTHKGMEAERARTLASVHRGLDSKSRAIDVEGWRSQIAGAAYPAPQTYTALTEVLSEADEAARKSNVSADAKLRIAEANLALALRRKRGGGRAASKGKIRDYARLLLIDARDAALDAKKLGASAWRADTALALIERELGDSKKAFSYAESAVDAMPDAVASENAIQVLDLFARARQDAILGALRARKEWPAEWLTDVHAAYSVLSISPFATDAQALSHYDFLMRLGATEKATRVLDTSLARFPDSPTLHDRLRTRILRERGLDALEMVYERMLKKPGKAKSLDWFAGYASMVTAEFQRRNGESAEALDAYERAFAHFERSIVNNAGSKASSEHFIAMAHAGRARVHMEDKNYGASVRELLAAFARCETATDAFDGLNLRAADTAITLKARLSEVGETDLLAQLVDRMNSMDQRLFRSAAFNAAAPGTNGGRPSLRRSTRRRGR